MVEPKTELQKNAVSEARKKELDWTQRTLDIQWINGRMENGRMGRSLALIQREAEMEKEYQERTDHAAIVNARVAKEIALGMEIANTQREETCAALRRHYLRERDPSLRDLMRKLQAGYVCRDLKQQILNNEYRRQQEKKERMQANALLHEALYTDRDNFSTEEKERYERNMKHRQDLQQQLVNRQLQRKCQYEESLIEKKMLDDIMRTIYDEDQRELKQKHELTERSRREMVTFKEAREAWRQKQKTMVIREEQDIERQRQAASDRAGAVIAERQRKLQAKDELTQKMAAVKLAKEEDAKEREDLIKLLQEQEYLEKNYQDDLSEKTKLEQCKKDTKEALTTQMNEKKNAAARAREAEAEFRKQSQFDAQKAEEKEQKKQLLLKEKNRKYNEYLMQQMEMKRQKKVQEKLEDAQQARRLADYSTKWQMEVSDERKKIIEDHVPQLLGYLQAGVIQKSDLPTVRAGADKHPGLANLDIEGMGVSKRPRRFSKCNAQCRILREY